MGWVWLLLAVVCSNLGNLAVKSASNKVAVSLTGYLCPSFLAGVAVFGLGLLFYARAIAALPLTIAYPVFVGATATGSAMIALIIYHERVSYMNVAGIALILGGLACLVGTKAPRIG